MMKTTSRSDRAALALVVLVLLCGFDRDDWPHWSMGEAEGDRLDTREEVLRSRAVGATLISCDERRCKVSAGRWRDPYAAREILSPKEIDLDHLVSLREADRSGAARWDRARRRAFANDKRNLVVTSASLNRSKGDRDPAEWLPPSLPARCWYVRQWGAVKSAYGLTMDPAEAAAVQRVLSSCSVRLARR